MLKYVIQNIEQLTDDTRYFTLVPVDNALPQYEPGHFFMLYIIESDASLWDVYRPYSVVSASNEHPKLCFAIKLQGKFTSRLFKLKKGNLLGVDGPFGIYSFYNDKPIILFAGGIGIPSILSYLRTIKNNTADKAKKDREIILFYSNRTIAECLFLDELKQITKKNSNIKVVFLFTKQPDAAFGEHNRINEQMFRKYVSSPKKYTYFVCGSKGFSSAVETILKKTGVPRQQIHIEAW